MKIFWIFQLGAVALLLLVLGCDRGTGLTPSGSAAGDLVSQATEQPGGATGRPSDSETNARGSTTAAVPGTTNHRTGPGAAPDSTVVSSGKTVPPPTPNPSNSDWVKVRLDAVIQLYHISESGVALLRSLDLRQMRGEPGFFGSYGFKGWAGVGEAKPIGVIHELSHSYWGGFPVEGFPGLSFETPQGPGLSPAMERYHADILAFMAQPPDDYEVFRERMRNLPQVSSENLEPLFHNLEADMVYGTGGNLALVPPVLRKYWGRFLEEGDFASWYEVVAWFQNLTAEDREIAGKYLGFEHLDLRRYDGLATSGGLGLLPADTADRAERDLLARDILTGEEKQRLFDLADQFDLLLGDPRDEEKFEFWRGYLRDKRDLHRKHPDYLASLDLPRADDLSAALDYLVGLDDLAHQDRANALGEQIPKQPFLVNFLPILDNQTLLLLFARFSGRDPLPQGATLQATASFVERLGLFGSEVDRVLSQGRREPSLGAVELLAFLQRSEFGPEEDLKLFFELLRDGDHGTAGEVVQALDRDTFKRLMEPVPYHLRTLLEPREFLEQLAVTTDAGELEFEQGIATLLAEPSGNFTVDEPFLNEMYQVVATRGGPGAQHVLRVLGQPLFPLEEFIQRQPEAAVALLADNIQQATDLVSGSDPVVSPPARIIYRLIYADPALASRLIQQFEHRGQEELVVESLAYIAYDQDRLARVPGLPISLEQDGEFLERLLRDQGVDWLGQRLGQAFDLFEARSRAGQVSRDFNSQFRTTLEAATSTLSDDSMVSQLGEIIAKAAAGGDGG
ncbi:MAG: hypothetical protein IIC96_04930 [Chloroflexi bacterium]|nr:hypothetical protein [Chloroflexota bacterium]